MEKGSITMRIAVTYEEGEVFQHFGHCAQFKLYDVDYNAVGKGNYEGSSESEQVSVDRMLDGVVMVQPVKISRVVIFFV